MLTLASFLHKCRLHKLRRLDELRRLNELRENAECDDSGLR